VEGLLHERTSEQQVAPEAIYAWHFLPELEDQDGCYGIPANHYYNPFGVDLLPINCGSGPATRRFIEAGNRAVSEDIDMWRVLVGLEGSVGAWKWEVSVAEARSDAITVERGFFVRPRYYDSLGPSGPDEAGHIVCGQPDPATGRVPATNIVPGCVPLNLFGGPGSIAQDQIDYMSPRPLTYIGTNEQRIADLLLRGPWGRIFDRDVDWALGASYLRDAGSFIDDPLNAEAINHLVSHTPVESGQYEVKELFAEVAVPLAHEQPWADDVVVNFGARWPDFSYFEPTTSWQTGLRWQVNAQVTLRSSYAEVYRAPTIDERYGPRGESIEDALDPCGNEPTPTQRAHCAANGVPGGAYELGEPGDPGDTRIPVLVISGGNPALGPETGRTVGVGLVYTPARLEGLSASIDYSRVEMYGFIGAVSVDDLLYGCAEYGIQTLCDAIRRLPDGSVLLALTMNRNLGWFENSALDIAIDWQTVTGFGDLTARVAATYLDRWDEQPVSGWPVRHYAGTNDAGALPRWRASGSVDWYFGRWNASYSAEYIGNYREWVYDYPSGIAFQQYRRQVDAILYHDVEAGFEFLNGVSVRAAISNVFDKDPPFVNSGSFANTDEATYRLLGRTYFLELRYSLN
jgi:outer membrane receptor protein involved in Fe transport